MEHHAGFAIGIHFQETNSAPALPSGRKNLSSETNNQDSYIKPIRLKMLLACWNMLWLIRERRRLNVKYSIFGKVADISNRIAFLLNSNFAQQKSTDWEIQERKP